MLFFVLILALILGVVPQSTVSDICSSSNGETAYEQTYENETDTGNQTEDEFETYDEDYSGNKSGELFDEIEEYENGDSYSELDNDQSQQNTEVTYEFSDPTGYAFGQNIVDGRYVFNTHVCSDRDAQMLGEDKREAFYNLCDALVNGNDTFRCDNKEAFIWATRPQFVDYFFPPASNCIKPLSYHDGVGRIEYLVPVDEFLDRVNAFEAEIEGVLNSTVSPEYSDFEKALILYDYMCQNYTYDYDILDKERRGVVKPYRAFENKSGICLELSGLYSYLLLQCGIQADFMRGGEGIIIDKDRNGHQWSFARINGMDYHIDPTYGLSKPDKCNGYTRLGFFLMSDTARQKRGKFDPEYYNLNAIKGEMNDNSMYKATDERYAELWRGYLVDLDTENNIVYYCDVKTGEQKEFYYDY